MSKINSRNYHQQMFLTFEITLEAAPKIIKFSKNYKKLPLNKMTMLSGKAFFREFRSKMSIGLGNYEFGIKAKETIIKHRCLI